MRKGDPHIDPDTNDSVSHTDKLKTAIAVWQKDSPIPKYEVVSSLKGDEE